MVGQICIGLVFMGLVPALASTALLLPDVAQGQTLQEVHDEIQNVRKELEEQRRLIAAQQQVIDDQAAEIRALTQHLTVSDDQLQRRGAGLDGDSLAWGPVTLPAPAFGRQGSPNDRANLLQPNEPAPGSASGGVPAALPDDPVGEEPSIANAARRAAVRAIPVEQSVLTPNGTLVFDPQIEYLNSSRTRLVFRGFELVPGIQIGLIEASDADRDVLQARGTLRYGFADRWEVEVRVPYAYRHDRLEIAQQREQSIVRAIELEGDGFGDVEFGLRYQINRLRPLRPVFIGSLRVKSDTGKSPFEVDFDEFGVANELATGTGFWGVQPGISFLMPSDPAVIYGGISYLYHIPRNIDRQVGGVFVGRVDPGDTLGAKIGFGFALNPQFSFSLGYKQTYVWPTETEIEETLQRSTRLQIGQFVFGMSVRVAESLVANFGLNVGVTEDAPDVNVSLRMPFDFNLGG